MLIHHFTQEQIEGHLRDLALRLPQSNKSSIVCFPIGRSGQQVLRIMTDILADSKVELSVIRVDYDRHKKIVEFIDDMPSYNWTTQPFLVLDSTIYTGTKMRRVVDMLKEKGATNIFSYSLAVRCNSYFIPSYWGIMVGEQDRVLPIETTLPNNRLNDKSPNVHIRKLEEHDSQRPIVVSGVDSMDRVTWGDRYFDMCNTEHGRCTYLLEMGALVVGYLTLHWKSGPILMIDEVAIQKESRKQGYGCHWALDNRPRMGASKPAS